MVILDTKWMFVPNLKRPLITVIWMNRQHDFSIYRFQSQILMFRYNNRGAKGYGHKCTERLKVQLLCKMVKHPPKAL